MKQLIFKFNSVEEANDFDKTAYKQYRLSERLTDKMEGWVFIRRANVKE